MSKKKVITLSVSLLLTVAVIAATWFGVAAAFITNNSYVVGRQGIFVPTGLNPNNTWVTTMSPSQAGFGPAKFSRPLMQLHFVNANGKSNSTPFILTYVFFNLRSGERRAWDKGDLKIYYKDISGGWKICNGFMIVGKNLPDGRVACLAPQYTLFGLGTPR